MPQMETVQSPARKGLTIPQAFEFLFAQNEETQRLVKSLTEENQTTMATAKEAREAARAAFDASDKVISKLDDVKAQLKDAIDASGKVPADVQAEIDGIFEDAKTQAKEDAAAVGGGQPEPAPEPTPPAPEPVQPPVGAPGEVTETPPETANA